MHDHANTADNPECSDRCDECVEETSECLRVSCLVITISIFLLRGIGPCMHSHVSRCALGSLLSCQSHSPQPPSLLLYLFPQVIAYGPLETREKLKSFWVNLGLVSALLVGVTYNTAVSPVTSADPLMANAVRVSAVFAGCSLVFSLGVVVISVIYLR